MDEQRKESIIKSAFRTFCKMFFGLGGILVALFLFFGVISPKASTVGDLKTTLSVIQDADGMRKTSATTAPAILQIDIHGVIGEPGRLDSNAFQNILTDSRLGMLSGNRVKGILLHFNTPGGAAIDSDTIYRLIKEYKEQYKVPVYGYVEGLCASGGMYIAASADKMFASPPSVIGSVGVRMGPFFNIYDLMEKVGVQAKTMTEGLDKDMLNPTRPWKEGEASSIQAVMSFMYQEFVNVVTTGRPQIDKSKLIHEYGAQVFDCVKAEAIGYIDVPMSSRRDALNALLEAADVSGDYQVVTLSPKYPWFSELVNSSLITGKIEHVFDSIPTSIREQPCFLYRYE